jgi:predicted porin
MKKSLIALAVLAASGAAMAQSSVTLYGHADVNYQWGNNKAFNGTKWSQQSGGAGGSRIGFRGVEDLGNGLKAGFVIEGGFDVSEGTSDDSSSSLGNRQSFVSLSGGFGEARFGKQYTVHDVFAGNFGGGLGTDWGLGATGLAHNGIGGRWKNTATYISPNYSGFTFTGQVATKEEASALNQKDRAPFAAAVDYANGPVAVGFAASKNGAEGKRALYQLGASYDFGPVALLGAYQYNSNLDGKHTGTIGLKAPFGATTVRVTYTYAQQASISSENAAFSTAADFNSDNAATSSNAAGKVQALGLGLDYKLSKRSTVYTGVNYVKAKNDAFGGKDDAAQALVGFSHWF